MDIIRKGPVAVLELFRAAIGPRRYFANRSRESLVSTAIWGIGSLLLLATLLLLVVALLSEAAWLGSVETYLQSKDLASSDFPAFQNVFSLPYEFPLIWIVLILAAGVLRFGFLFLLGNRERRALKWTLVLAAFSMTPMIVNGLFAAITGNLFPIGVDYNSFEAARVIFATLAVAITWVWEGYITVVAYGAIFGQATGRAVLTFLFPWVVMYLLTYIV